MKTILVDAAGTFTVETAEGSVIDKKLQALLDEYENQKIIVTNASQQQRTEYGLTDVPYDMFSLSNNPGKPDPVYFQKLLDQYDLKAADIIYFEHDSDAVESARSLDIKSFHFDHELRDYDSLKSFINNNL